MATLSESDCYDFSRLKLHKPCMHIYRLAIELGLIEAKYLDRDARHSLAVALSREETIRLQRFAPDPKGWGSWAPEIHSSGVQRNRQYRAYLIHEDEPDSVSNTTEGWFIHDYRVTLGSCACMDFLDRNLPCKHIYAAALNSKITLPFTYAEYETAKKQGLGIVFEFPTQHQG
jgi:hypothetical protein